MDRLDIYNWLLIPVGVSPKRQMPIEATDIMLLMVAYGRSVAALPRWLVEKHAATSDVRPIRLGRDGVTKPIFLDLREADAADSQGS